MVAHFASNVRTPRTAMVALRGQKVRCKGMANIVEDRCSIGLGNSAACLACQNYSW
jgi:hypothetical protein